MVAAMTAASAHSLVAKAQQESPKHLQQVYELSDEAIKALLSKTRRHKKSRSGGKHPTSPLLRQVLRRSLLDQIGQRKKGL